MADVSTLDCAGAASVAVAPSAANHVVRKQELDPVQSAATAAAALAAGAIPKSRILSKTLNAGDQAITVDFAALGLEAAPSVVLPLMISKTASGQDNIYATLIEGTVTATAATFDLLAPCDATGSKLYFMVV